MAVQIQYRRGTAAEWTAANPVLALGEPGYETDTGKFKVGNGVNTWTALAYSSGTQGPTGPQGDTGPTGPAGAAATIAVGTTTTGAAGSSASVSNSGTSSAAVFNFTIPRGDKGDTGNTGAAATVAVGTTTTGAAGTSASVTNSGTSSAATFNFTIPRGDTGATGNTGPQGPMGPKAITITAPTSSEKVALFFTTTALTVAQIRSLVSGTTPSVTFSIRYGTDFSAAGTEVVTSGITVTNTTTGLSTTSFNNASIPANNFVWLTTSATSGTVTALHASLIFS